MPILDNKKKVHFIGIGGIGMSGLARILTASGYKVSGSDIKKSRLTEKLKSLNIKVKIGHHPDNITGSDLVIYSSSIDKNNIELQTAQRQGIPIIRRGRLLAELMNNKKGIAVCGTHGKTTTSSLISYMLHKAGLSPTLVVGAEVPALGGNAHKGKGEFFVAEADESDGSFLYLKPFYSIITNIESEHLDFYRNINHINNSYKKFMNQTKKEGCLFACYDDENIKKLLANYDAETVTFGLNKDADLKASHVRLSSFSSTFDCSFKEAKLGTFKLNIPGKHNIVNSLAAIAIGIRLGLSENHIKKGLSLYSGANRRFQIKGRVNNITVIEDYAHHPTEIEVTLKAALGLKSKRIVIVFQPHRYSRTKHFKERFSNSLKVADYIVLTDIYSASEKKIKGVSTQQIYDMIKQSGHKSVHLLPKEKIKDHLLKIVKPEDLVLILGAGDVGRISDELVQELKQHV